MCKEAFGARLVNQNGFRFYDCFSKDFERCVHHIRKNYDGHDVIGGAEVHVCMYTRIYARTTRVVRVSS